jgi:hypothetical protein
MIVFQNSLITLTYTPDTDILSVDWPDVEYDRLLEMQESLHKVIEVLKSYDVKKLLIDASTGTIRINYSEYQALIREFAMDLVQTRLQKIARVLPNDPERDESVVAIRKEMTTSIHYQDFKTKAAALRWLSDQ